MKCPPNETEAPDAERRTRLTGGARRRALLAASLLLLAFVSIYSVRVGSTGTWSIGRTWQGLIGLVGFGQGLDTGGQLVFELRLHRTLTALGVGAALALSGAILQGVLRNDLAAPSVVGVTGGATLGASLAILALGGADSALMLSRFTGWGPLVVSIGAAMGGFGALLLVVGLAGRRGGPTLGSLLLLGIAINATVGGVLALIHSIALRDYRVAQAMLTWNLGRFDDRLPAHTAMVWSGLAVAVCLAPFLARGLDLLASGEEDAAALGVDVRRLSRLSLLAAAFPAALAVAAAGQIGFVGLVVPHVVRRMLGPLHGPLFVGCVIGGPLVLVGLDLAQRLLLGDLSLPPGVLMALIGGPAFFVLLLKREPGDG